MPTAVSNIKTSMKMLLRIKKNRKRSPEGIVLD